jgi:SagB-type dehydrogenase family enzyme
MRAGVDLVSAQHIGQSFATDRDLTLPLRPRLIPELIALPLGQDGLMFVGAEELQVFRGRSARAVLPRLLPLLDGRHTLGELEQKLCTFRPAALRDIVSLLFSRGLLEDGRPPQPIPDVLSDVAGFLGRYIDASRRHSSRSEVLRHLAAATVSIVGPQALAAQIAQELSGTGVGTVHFGHKDRESATLTIVLSTGETPDLPQLFTPVAGAQTLLVRLGNNEAQIGPLLVEGVTACPACVCRVHPHPAGVPDELRAALWTGLAAHFAFLSLSQLPPGRTLRGFRVQRFEDGQLIEETRLEVRMPGCTRCGIAGESWSPEDPRMLAWIYHCATSIPSREMLSPKDHQAHYLATNARLASEHRRIVWSEASSPLVESTPVACPSAGRSTPSDSKAPIAVSTLSSLLVRIVGEVGESGHRRRLVPTGGNLGSVSLWVIVRKVTGLTRGAYAYDAPRHALDFVGPVDDDALRQSLRSTGPLPDCLLVGAGLLAKCAQKYQAFAYRLIHLDAGVALGFAHLAANALGLELREYAEFRLDLPGAFGIPSRWEFPLSTFALGIGQSGMLPTSPAAMEQEPAAFPPIGPDDYSFEILPRLLDFAAARPARATASRPAEGLPVPSAWACPLEVLDTILLARRAVREFAEEPIAANVVEQVAASASDAIARRLAAGAPPCFVRPLLAIALATGSLPRGTYDTNPATGELHRRGDFSPALSEECSNQLTLASAPVTLFVVGNIRSALTERGGKGYSELAVHAGASVGEAWLRATSLGLIGTAAGGVVLGGLRLAAGLDGFHECPLLALHLGLPRSGGVR